MVFIGNISIILDNMVYKPMVIGNISIGKLWFIGNISIGNHLGTLW